MVFLCHGPQEPQSRAHFNEQFATFQSWLLTHMGDLRGGVEGGRPLVIGTLGIFNWGYLRMDYPPNDSGNGDSVGMRAREPWDRSPSWVFDSGLTRYGCDLVLLWP